MSKVVRPTSIITNHTTTLSTIANYNNSANHQSNNNADLATAGERNVSRAPANSVVGATSKPKTVKPPIIQPVVGVGPLPPPLPPLNTATLTLTSSDHSTIAATISSHTTANQQAYKGADCLARRRQLSRWLRQVSSGVQSLSVESTSSNNLINSKQQQVLVESATSSSGNEYDQVSEPEDDTYNSYSHLGDKWQWQQQRQQQQRQQQQLQPQRLPDAKRHLQLKQAKLITSLTWQPAIRTPKLVLNQSTNNIAQNLPSPTKRKSISSSLSQLVSSTKNQLKEANNYNNMATVRPISPQYQHALDSAISLAKELASRNMADSGESSPKTPNSPDKKRFNFKLKHFSKSFSEASANIRDIESSISYEAKMAYKSLVERGPFNSYHHPQHDPMSSFGTFNHIPHHSHTLGPHHHHPSSHHNHHQYANDVDDFSPTFTNPHSKLKHVSASTFSVKKSIF